jgi:hypothetical protein
LHTFGSRTDEIFCSLCTYPTSLPIIKLSRSYKTFGTGIYALNKVS